MDFYDLLTDPTDTEKALAVAQTLASAGIPIFIAKPARTAAGEWDPTGGSGGSGYVLPDAWQRTVADPEVVEKWEEGDALCAVMGHSVDGVDVDPRHNGDQTARDWQAAGLWPRSLGRQATPSGGWHELVNPLRVRSRDDALPGVDVKAGDAEGNGRGFLFIAPTVKLSKSTGQIDAYRWEDEPNLDELDPNDDSGMTLAGAIQLKRKQSAEVVDLPHDAYDQLTDAKRESVARYLAATVRNLTQEMARVAEWPEGYRDENGRGWQKALADVCWRLGQLARADWTPWTMQDAEQHLRDIVPTAVGNAIGLEDTWHAHRSRGDAAVWPAQLDEELPNATRVASEGTRVPSDAGEHSPADLLRIVTASDVKISRVRYLWEGRVPLGSMTLMPGEEGIGKTTVGVWIIAAITRGTLQGELYGQPQDALVLAPEDGVEDVFTPRLKEAGADLTRVHFVKARVAMDESDLDVIVPRDLPALSEAVEKYNAALVWIDSLVTTLPEELKSISYKDTATALKRISTWAEATGVAVAAPWHLNKSHSSDTAIKIMDSRAFRTAVRSMLLVVADPEAEDGISQGVVALDKANASTLAVPALRYRIDSAPYTVDEVDEQTGEVREIISSCGVVTWLGEVEGDGRAFARELLTPMIQKEGSPAAWLRDYLQGEGEVARLDVIAAATAEGFSESSIKRASRSLKVVSRDETGQDPSGRPFRRSIWSLPQSGHTHPTGPTDPTGEGSIDPTDLVSAGQPQWGQSGQSGLGGPTGNQGDPTEDARALSLVEDQLGGRLIDEEAV